MRTHVDTVLVIRRRETDLFMIESDGLLSFRPMCAQTTFIDENDETTVEDMRRACPDAEVVRVSRVIDIVS